MSMSHITIKQRGQEPRPHRCHADASLFTCPFCSTDVCKPRQYHQIMTHIAGHKLRAVEYGDHVIYSCYIGCGKTARHFHCCQCPKIYINKGALKKHLSSSHPITTCTLKPQPVSDPQEPPSQQPSSQPQQEPPSQQPASQPQQDLPSQKPASHPQEPPSQKPASHPQQEPPSKQPQQEPPSQKPASHPQEPPSSQPQQEPPSKQPQQEPPSQQPASQPQEPSSQKPQQKTFSQQPQQEPPSQQPTSQPQETSSQKPQQKTFSQQPQQEPPSQQPTSQPQEPSSQKPQQKTFSQQPQQEPPSQQPASQPQEPSSQKPQQKTFSQQPQQEPPSQQPTSQPQEPSSQKPQQKTFSQQPQQEPPSQQPASKPQEPSSQKPQQKTFSQQPQQEPPSQQPASQPQEPSSQKPQQKTFSQQPQQEPPSQQPASQPQEPSSQKPQQKTFSQQPQQEPPSQQPTSQPQEPSSQKPQQKTFSQQPQQEPPSQQPTSQPQEPSSQKPQQKTFSQQPQQEPPSQQPASQPQEPSSQKSASHPQQEPPSQKPQQEPPSQKPQEPPSQKPQQEPPSQKPQQEPPSQKPQQEPPSQKPQQEPPSQKPQQEPPSQKPQQEPPSQKPQQEPPSQKPQQEPPSQKPQQEPPSQQPQQEPPSQQPQQEPSSQQPASQQEPSSQQPQQEPSSQKPASHPLQLAAPPAIKRISLQCRRRHITIKQRGQEPRPHRCHADASLFTCPFCSTDVCKPRQYHQIMTHIAGHKLRAVEYGDHVIYSCNIGCGKMARHFHCCQCPKTYINKSALKKHLCSSHPIATCTLKPQPASDPQQEPPSQKPASPPQKESPSQQPASQPQQDPPSQQPSDPLQLAAPPAIKSHRRHITIKQRGQEPRPHRCHADASLFTCPFCSTDVCKPRQYHQIMTHIAGHKLRAVEYGDHVIYSCNIGCGKMARHFHCFQCPKTYINKADLKKHLCSSHPIATCTLKPQPASDPQQEPPSEQPASPPQQEPPLQQPASPPLQLAAPPVIKRRQISVQCRRRHITIKQRGQDPQPQRCNADATLFTCPFCSTDVCKPRKYQQIMTHIARHKLSAVEYGDYVIYSCNSCGEKARHFHCCQCPQTYFNQGALKRHLCNTHPVATCTPEPHPVGRPLQEPLLQQPAPRPLELAAQRVIVKRKQISVQCPHCRVNLNSKNLKMHIKRKHHEAMHPITSTWDSSHKVICDIDICKSCVETAPRSELLVTQCVSLSSVDFSCAAETSEDLSEDMLTEME